MLVFVRSLLLLHYTGSDSLLTEQAEKPFKQKQKTNKCIKNKMYIFKQKKERKQAGFLTLVSTAQCLIAPSKLFLSDA